ncbi:BAG family molecular chaperone regulator 6-like isoform X1 [Gossypium australe]|uniref:BAG family molecular chaperone regulator 6-like isoform X1 n=1 Tax=Gossypium australe TaxID=47621 RepID=A0A5B6VKG9_9ROSI|nr:BAG family molecular chaperone regulator 6-like isoform X1 [Gossypium australe]
MMPVSGYMDSNPHLRNQAPYPSHCLPSFEAVPPHFKADPSKSPLIPFPHFAPSPAFHHYPNYPAFPEPYPLCYTPPHYLNQQPRYEYDKDPRTNYHCCGCPNHLHNQKNDTSLKIEEQENNAEKKEGDSEAPIQPSSFPYPIMWIPPEYMKSKEHGKHNDRMEVSDSDKVPCARPSKSLKSTEQEPGVWNGWFPLDMNGWKSLMQGEGEKQSRNQHNQDNMTQFPVPIFWLPNSDRKQEDENRDKRRMITASDNSKQAPVKVEFIPGESSVSNVKLDKPESDKEISQNKNAAETRGKTTSQKCVPIEVKEGKSEGTEKKGKDVKDKKNDNGNGSSTSPSPHKGQPEDTLTKASAAPGRKEDAAVNTRNTSGSLDSVEPVEKKIKEIPVIAERPKDTKENKARENISTNQAKVLGDSQEVLEQPTVGKTIEDNHENKTEEETKTSFEEVMGAEKEADSIEVARDQCKTEVGRMSDDEAAKLIQSAFRGFKVRKWEPLKKLKQIADVREQVNEVRNHIQSLESSTDHNKDDKLRLLAGEKIMTLLLRLDSIQTCSYLEMTVPVRLLIQSWFMFMVQGLHSSVRDLRKSLVKELVSLQEKLDSLTRRWTEEKAEDLGTTESADCPNGQVSENISMEKESENASAALEESTENANDITVLDQQWITHMVDGEDGEITELPFVEQGIDGKTENNSMEASHRTPRIEDGGQSPNLGHATHLSSIPEHKFNADDVMEVNDLTKEEKPGVVEVNDQILVDINSEDNKLRSLPKADQVDAVGELEKEIGNKNGEKESDLPINTSSPDEAENLQCTEKDQEINLLEMLPVGVIDEELAISKIDEHLLEAEPNNGVEDEKEIDLFKELPAGVIDEHLLEAEPNNGVEDEKEIDLFKELPAGVIDEHLLEAEPNNGVQDEKEVEISQEEVDDDDNKCTMFFEPEEIHSTIGEENNEDLQRHEDDSGVIPVDHMASSESEAGSEATQEKLVLFEEMKAAEQPVGREEKEEAKLEKEMNMLLQADAPWKPNVAKIGEDNKVVEENKKLNEMMEKLMEAGKDQLTVISNLTERVKELEEKLSKTKKLSTAGYRKVRYAPSYYKLGKIKRKASEVAM